MNKNILSKSIKILVGVLAFTLCLAVVSFADGRPEYDPDNATALLKNLGILEEGFSPNGSVSREGFVGYAVKLIGLDKYNADKDLPFTDVAINDANYAAIVAAYDAGLINGNSTNTFAPFDDITLPQACKILTKITGYSPIADATGGYSAGYLTTAQKAGLLDGVDGSEEIVSKKSLVALLYNALTIDVYKQISFGDSMVEYGYREGETLLLQTFKIRYGEGIVTSNKYTSLTGSGTNDDSTIEIGENGRFQTDSDISDLLGYDTYYFCEDKSSNPRIVAIFKKAANESVVVKDESFIKFENNTLYYEDENGTERKKKTDGLFDIIYNGAANPAWDYSDFKVTNGSFEFLDNDSDGDIDVVFIKSYVDYVVRGVSASAEMITLDFSKGSIAMNDDSIITRITDKGKEIEYASLVKGDILSVGESKANDGVKIRIIEVSHNGFSGAVAEISEDKAVVNQKEYGYINYPGQLDMYMGLSGMFFVNAAGKIVACDPGDRYLYGYVRGAKTMGDLDTRVAVKLLCSAGTGCEYMLSDNARVDGRSDLSETDILSRVKVDEVIRYRLNNNGEIISIDTISEGSKSADDVMSFDNTYSSTRYKSNARYFYEINRLLDNETVIFVVPDNGNENEYEVANLSYLINDERYDISLYDVDEMLITGAAVVGSNAETKKPSNTEAICIITGIGEKLSDSGESVVSFTVNKSGLTIKEYWAYTEDKEVYEGLKTGDIVQFKVSANEGGRVLATRLLHSCKTPSDFGHTKISENDYSFTISWGEVEAVEDSAVLLDVGPGDNEDLRPYYLKAGLSFYIYNVKDESVTAGTESDLAIGDKVFLRENYFAVQEGVIIR